HFFILFFFTLNPAVISLPKPSFFFCEYLTARKKMPTASQLPRPSILRGKGLLSLLLCFIIIS
ncbi:hypothetical protein, partial [[Ruminococcus] torques]|uniref:hypothetical protein n=1 Tax=[Ruminococcus] torques TaxID=33039 RepID=UPI0039956A80